MARLRRVTSTQYAVQMESNAPTRPALESVQNEAEFARWYWTKDELTQECRRRGLVASGAKADWAATRNLDRREIGAQFELNRFTREWHELNPTGDRDQALAAWQAHRALPIELR